MLRRLLKQDCRVCVSSPSSLYPIRVESVELNEQGDKPTLTTECDRATLESHLSGDRLVLDLEVHKEKEHSQCFTAEQLAYEYTLQDDGWHEIICHLEPSAIDRRRRGGVRIPFVHGVSANAVLNIFDHEQAIKGRVLDLSRGGCKIQIPIEESAVFCNGQPIHRVSIDFPNGEAPVRRPVPETYWRIQRPSPGPALPESRLYSSGVCSLT